ncbi:uncharacterized protein LOC108912050 [Anoplophora glabripennis]|uniref:uncharacterized protein LOC108912050 n=1 Tax=Anoplophora glabripennis TaxID=217634 RepID=UPI000C791E30|nr:uncharacterized protein LOC108912050 [Anoplophora glabripennis]
MREYKILSTKREQSFPLVYDLLLTIFSFTDQNIRQYHFHQFLDHYYKCLQTKMQKLSLDVTKCLPLARFQSQLHKFLPFVKLDILKQCCQAFINETSRKKLKQYETIRVAILEIIECVSHPNLSREDCYKILKNKIGSSDYRLLNYRLIPLQEREGYLGDYFKLKIEVEYAGTVKLLHLFSKYLPTYSDMAMDLAKDSFKKEEFYYLEFIPELNDLGLKDITNFLPKCYFSRTNEVLIFEDMTMMNYKTVHVSVTYSYEMLLITIKQLDKIHASSLLYEELLSKKTNEIVRIDVKYPDNVEEKTVCKKETLAKKTLDCAITTFLNMLSKFLDIPKKFSMEEFQKRGQLAFDLCFEKVKKSDKFRNVFCQGDCWASNILFKNDKDSMPIDCYLVDFQLTRYCPPAHDLMFLFYMSTTKEIRTKYKSKLLREYYSELSNILQRYKIDLQKIYTYQQFLEL